ncbi:MULTISPECIES: ComEA family DNA-binding protein [Corynebacterium]|uniref:ComEA protein n=1 Tax=Corynebacterium lipophiloflavum (strain ATCC 700352 / DSM 44291 / CCUG 37336 / JCM 10383 / DMMZ 1944) TaxID=525263 RepID=C0XRJ4_CORLD|nr:MULTISPECIES: ComEA family DNA-binding protein [Corynebacterium]EEI17126.1 comEA protein [Corynebacterium lipophiloflavum DSM 44291]MCT1597289.1 ComEA family DNA-binding protein [Corynebacterium sanguinis]MCT1629348.1 ComEA family DNA-binding protein [Corynebacterium sanguinis]
MSRPSRPSSTDRITELLRPTGEEDRLAVEFPPPRVRVEPLHAAVAVAVVLALVAGWAFLRPAAPEPQWDTAAVEAPPAQVVVSVVGEVANPGLVTLEQGARVADALKLAAPLPQADLISLNQAQLLVDGQQIHVQAVGAAPAGPAAQPPAPGLVSLNSASAAELTTLPGVGDATAAAIIAHREANGPFASVEQLMDVKGIGPAKFEALKDLVGV